MLLGAALGGGATAGALGPLGSLFGGGLVGRMAAVALLAVPSNATAQLAEHWLRGWT